MIAGTKKVVVHLQVSVDNKVTGTSHLYYNNKNNYEHYAVHGEYNPLDSTIIIIEDSVIAVHHFFGTCTGDYVMKLTASDTLLKFNGKWMENDNTGSGCGSNGVWLNKPIKKKPVEKKIKT